MLSRIPEAEVCSIDIARAEGPWGKRSFLESLGVGSVAEGVARSGPRPPTPIRIEMGREDLQELVKNAEPEMFELQIDGEKFVGEFLFVEVLNLSFTGPALPLAFHALPNDGLLDVVFLEAKDRQRMLAWLGENPEETPPTLTVRQGNKVKMLWEGGQLRMDSCVFFPTKSSSEITITLERRSLKFMVPSDGSR